MPHRVTHFLDILASIVPLFLTAIASRLLLIISPVDSVEDIQDMRDLLFPMIGAGCSFTLMILLNPSPQKETRRIIVGRSFFAFISGTLCPKVVMLWHPWIEASMRHKEIAVLMGIAFGMFGYAIAVLLTMKLMQNAQKVVDLAEKKFDQSVGFIEQQIIHGDKIVIPKGTVMADKK